MTDWKLHTKWSSASWCCHYIASNIPPLYKQARLEQTLIESILNNQNNNLGKSFNVAIYSAPQNWNEENGIYLFESLFAHTATELCIIEWTPELPNGIHTCLMAETDTVGKIYYGEKTSREAVTESLRSFI